jgi:imidazolonepropionase-like amidohydrolase
VTTPQTSTPQIYIAARVWNGIDRRPIERGFVEVEGSRIKAIGAANELGSDRPTHDLGDVTLMPGLINAHVHITFAATPTLLDDYFRERDAGLGTLMERAKENLAQAVRVGCTTVRDLGTLNDIVFAARDGVRNGSIDGPDIVAAGEGITSHGGHCYFFGIEAEGTDAVRAAVLRQYDAGADVIKIFATGGNLTPGTDPFAPQFSQDELAAAVEEARTHDLPVSSHAHSPEGIRRSVAARVDTIEHCMFETPTGVEFDERAAAAMAEAGIAAVPTHGVSIMRYLDDPSLIDALPEARQRVARRLIAKLPEIMKNSRRMQEIGVDVIAGSDAGIPNRRFDHFAADLSVLANENGVGLGAFDALVAATSRCAERLGLDDRGLLQPGRRADLLAVEGNPLERIEDAQRTSFVAVAGRVIVQVV